MVNQDILLAIPSHNVSCSVLKAVAYMSLTVENAGQQRRKG